MRWVLVACDCDDGYDPFCRLCEGACDHDGLCPQCKGTGWRPERATVLDHLVGGEMYPTKRAALIDAIG